jgi:hypothetical protein
MPPFNRRARSAGTQEPIAPQVHRAPPAPALLSGSLDTSKEPPRYVEDVPGALSPEERVARAEQRARPLKPRFAEARRDRLTLLMSLHFQSAEYGTKSIDVTADRYLDTFGEEPSEYGRLLVGEDPVRLLSKSVVENPGVVYVENRTGVTRPSQPSPEEYAADEAAVLIIERPGDAKPIAVVPRGVPFVAMPFSPEELTVRSAAGTATARVAVFPR